MHNIRGFSWRLIAIQVQFAQPLIWKLPWWLEHPTGDGVSGQDAGTSSHSLISSSLWSEHLWILGKSLQVWLYNRISLTHKYLNVDLSLSVLVHHFPAVVGKTVTSLLSSSSPGSWELLRCCGDRSDTQQAAQLSQAQAETYLYMALTRTLFLSLTAFSGFLNVQQLLYLQVNQVPRGRRFSEV